MAKLNRLSVFTFLWALATMFHYTAFSWGDHKALIVLLFAGMALVRPTSLYSLLALSFVQLIELGIRLPHASNHWYFTGFVNLTILASYFYYALRLGKKEFDSEAFFDTFAPAVRLEVVVLYFYAVFHKLNSDFLFNLDVSCGTYLYETQAARWSFMPLGDAYNTFSIWATLIIEGLIPVFLLFRRTALFGVLLGVLFHGVLGFNTNEPYFNFSSMVSAMFFLFVPRENMNPLNEILDQIGSRFRAIRDRLGYSGILLVMLAFAGIIIAFYQKFEYEVFNLVVWSVYVLLYSSIVVAVIRTKTPQLNSISLRSNVLGYTLVALTFLNGFAPYLGIKTYKSYSMYSNLITEGGKTNHVIVPASFQVFPYTHQVVEIHKSSDAYLDSLSRNNEGIILFELKRYLNKKVVKNQGPISLTCTYGGKRYEEANVYSNDLLSTPNSKLLQKVLYFRTFKLNEPQICKN